MVEFLIHCILRFKIYQCKSVQVLILYLKIMIRNNSILYFDSSHRFRLKKFRLQNRYQIGPRFRFLLPKPNFGLILPHCIFLNLYFLAVIMHNFYYRQQHQWSENKFTHFWKQDEQFTNYKYKESPASAVSISTVLAVPGLVRFSTIRNLNSSITFKKLIRHYNNINNTVKYRDYRGLFVNSFYNKSYCAQNQKIFYIPILVRNTVFPQMVVATSILFGRVKVQQLGIPKREPISVCIR